MEMKYNYHKFTCDVTGTSTCKKQLNLWKKNIYINTQTKKHIYV